MPLTLRIDLDYVPWDTPDSVEFGHGEPAALLRLLDLARALGARFHFFASNRVLRAFPATAEAVLNEGHDLDWFAKHPSNPDRYANAVKLFEGIGHRPIGAGIKGAWPTDCPMPDGLLFLSSAPGFVPTGVTHFAVQTKSDRDAARSGISAHDWADSLKTQVREAATRNQSITICIRPQVLAKFDPKLAHIKEILDLARAIDLPLSTLRQAINAPRT